MEGPGAMRFDMLFVALVVPGFDGDIHAETDDGIFRSEAPERGRTVLAGLCPREERMEAVDLGPTHL